MASSVPRAWLDGCIDAQRRLDAVVERVTDEIARRPSLLEGWTVGHVLAHLARNADSHRGMVEAARRDEVADQYPGGRAERERGIEEGHGRPASELIADVKESNRRLEAAWAATNEETWAVGLGLRRRGPTTVADNVWQRWREVEIHMIDLGLADVGGPGWDDVSDGYLDVELRETIADLDGRVPAGTTVVLVPGDRPSRAVGNGDRRVFVRAAPRRILAWLVGRGGEPSWPQLGPWG
ncbi:MAG: maleylpyruvate isomerase N-terminal domain-containing protein [Chloroflexota bacterium]|nr:maleylpyruvate isomerase N-terminal domain-containing protein [Chloroflexota bacterium]